MKLRSRSLAASKRRKTHLPQLFLALAVLCAVVGAFVVLAADEECDVNSHIYVSPGENLCVPAASSNSNFTIDGVKTGGAEWVANTYYEFGNFWNAGVGSRVWVSRKATGINKSDLYLLFQTGSDSVPHGEDEVRISLNPGVNPAASTLIKIHPFNVMPTLPKEVFTFNPGPGTWNSAGSGDAWLPPANVANHQDVPNATWSLEIRIPLDAIPTNPITTPDFRLSLQVIASDGVMRTVYQWPDQSGAPGLNDNMCSNPNRWFPMSFATGTGANCPHPDVSIANGLYSCDAIYVLRAGNKSSEIGINEVNEFHADVTNPGPGTAANCEVYLTLLHMGTSTGPLAMNYDNANAAITQFFTDKYGGWMTATDKMDTGTPKPPVPFNVPPGTNTDARFNWKPADETRFGDPAGFVGTHRCTAAFVNFKDDPNFANNFSFCNTSLVSCPAGEICPMDFWVGQIYPFVRPRENIKGRFFVSAINEPFPGWLGRTQFKVEGEQVERLKENIFEVPLPVKGEVPLKFSIVPPREGPPIGRAVDDSFMPTAYAQATAPQGENDDPIKERNARLKKIYGNKPIIVIQQVVPGPMETGLDGKSKIQLYLPTAYVAFVIDGGAGATPTPTPKPSSCSCGRASAKSLAFSSFIVFFGLAFIWRRTSRRSKVRSDRGIQR